MNPQKIFEMEGKGKKLWKKFKYDHQLVDYNSLPAYLKDNEFILRYYRSEWPLKQAILSIFYIHNETVNVWTHLIGFLLFLSLTIYTAAKVPNSIDIHSLQQLSDDLRKVDFHKIREEVANCLISLPNMAYLYRLKDELTTSFPSTDMLSSFSGRHISEVVAKCLPKQLSANNRTEDPVLGHIKGDDNIADVLPPSVIHQPITRWPFFAFLGGAMFCLLASTSCHLLGCHSESLRYVVLRLDYAGIAALIATSFYPPVYYSFMCHPLPLYLYLSSITAFGAVTVLFSLLPVFQKPHFRPFRTVLFFAMGISGVAPVIHKIWLHGNQPEVIETTRYEVVMGLLYGLGAFIYASRIPERWRPGKFDLAGSSHQIFHVLVVAGAYTHYRAGLIYLEWRQSQRC